MQSTIFITGASGLSRSLIIKEFAKQHIPVRLQQSHIIGIKYSVFKMGNNSFVHIAQFPNEAISDQVIKLPAFKQFLSNLENRLEQEPIANDILEIGCYTGCWHGNLYKRKS